MERHTDSSAEVSKTVECSRCGRKDVTQCVQCRAHLCEAHIHSSDFLALQFFGSSVLSADQPVCHLCYEEKLWHASRFASVMCGLIGVLVGALEGLWAPVLIGLAAMLTWWWLSGHRLHILHNGIHKQIRSRDIEATVTEERRGP